MHPFDPQQWWGVRPGGTDHGDPQDPNLDRAVICGLAAAACLCLASFAPPPLVPHAAAVLLFWAALGSAAEAALRGQHPLEEHLTAWDQAAALLAASLLLRLAFGAPPEGVPEAMTAP
ncbi:hypothetical protein [Crenalkalicoccus roseus]|uniref:hypothetical protein n=1 Tax=Crenalkalicoccus roseus TaxID=1485588 RepID=UPI00108152D7|nr:hypothetical protein [Crenalkalicoccus roseus]